MFSAEWGIGEPALKKSLDSTTKIVRLDDEDR